MKKRKRKTLKRGMKTKMELDQRSYRAAETVIKKGNALERNLLHDALVAYETAKAETRQPDESLHHLGNVLVMLAELHPDDQCRAYTEA